MSLLVGMFGLSSFELGRLEYEVGVFTLLTAVLMNEGHVAFCFRWKGSSIHSFQSFLFSGSPPCPDYVTPLKKRRLARESLSSEQSFTPPTTPTMLTDQHLSSSSPPTQKCVQYDVTCLNMVSVENNILLLLCSTCV
jgi:hypothetical protein